MRSPLFPALAAIIVAAGLPSEGSAQYQTPKSREQALIDARRYLAKCEAMAAESPQLGICLRSCQRAVDEIPAGSDSQVARLHHTCHLSIESAEKMQKTLAADEKSNAERKNQAEERREAFRRERDEQRQKAEQEREAERQRQVELQRQADQQRQTEKQRKAEEHRKAEEQRRAEQRRAEQAEQARAAAVEGQAQAGASASSAAAGKMALRVDGAIDWGEYENGRTMHSVFVGDFDRFRKGSLAVRVLMHEYLVNFQESCAEFLPPDAVTVVSTMTQVYRDAYGAQYSNVVSTERITMAPRFTYGYQNFPLGPGVYAITGGLGDRNAVRNVVRFITDWRNDTDRFFEVESCQGATMLQMGENLSRLTAGEQPIQAEPNAAQVLASRRVRAPQAVEANDSSAKRAKADAFWSKERASWAQPPRTQPITFAGGGGRLKIDYTAVAPDFVIPIPDTDQYVEINVEKSYARRIRWIHVALGGLPHYIIGEHTSDQNHVYLRDQQVLLKEGAKIMSCTYDAMGVLKTVSYWYREMPKSMDPASLRASAPNHPLLAVRAPRTSCPVAMPQ